MNAIITALMAIGFGFGASLTVLGLSIYYKLFFTEDSYQSLFMILLAFVFVWVGLTITFFVMW